MPVSAQLCPFLYPPAQNSSQACHCRLYSALQIQMLYLRQRHIDELLMKLQRRGKRQVLGCMALSCCRESCLKPRLDYSTVLCVLFSTSIQYSYTSSHVSSFFFYSSTVCLQCAPTSTIQIMYTVLYSVQYAFYSMFVYLSTSLIMFLTMFILSITLITF